MSTILPHALRRLLGASAPSIDFASREGRALIRLGLFDALGEPLPILSSVRIANVLRTSLQDGGVLPGKGHRIRFEALPEGPFASFWFPDASAAGFTAVEVLGAEIAIVFPSGGRLRTSDPALAIGVLLDRFGARR